MSIRMIKKVIISFYVVLFTTLCMAVFGFGFRPLQAQEVDPEAGAIPEVEKKQAADDAGTKEVAVEEGKVKASDVGSVTDIEKFEISIADPADKDHWEKTADFDPPTIISFTDKSSGSRMDVLATKVVREQYAKALFEAFEEQLLKSEFTVAVEGKAQTVGAINGVLTEYDYTESKIMLRTMVFSFSSGHNAYLVVGYFSRAESHVMREAFMDFIAHFKVKVSALPDGKIEG